MRCLLAPHSTTSRVLRRTIPLTGSSIPRTLHSKLEEVRLVMREIGSVERIATPRSTVARLAQEQHARPNGRLTPPYLVDCVLARNENRSVNTSSIRSLSAERIDAPITRPTITATTTQAARTCNAIASIGTRSEEHT